MRSKKVDDVMSDKWILADRADKPTAQAQTKWRRRVGEKYSIENDPSKLNKIEKWEIKFIRATDDKLKNIW